MARPLNLKQEEKTLVEVNRDREDSRKKNILLVRHQTVTPFPARVSQRQER
jgi:hypothetical protein